MRLLAGTSGYAYKEWKGSFYPKDLPASQMLRYYGERFQSVEINNTFYRMPKSEVLGRWTDEVPAGFKFVIKAPQRITHFQRLRNTDDSLSYLLRVIEALESHLGPILFQTPPDFKEDAARLDSFLGALPRGYRAAFEFRHQSWFVESVFDVLRKHGAVLCIAEADNDLQIPVVSTADWGYLRLRKPDYHDNELKEWVHRVHAQGWQEAFVFFKHEEAGKGPAMAQRFIELYGSEDGSIEFREAA